MLQRQGPNQKWPTIGQMGRPATSPLPSGGLATLQSGGQNQKWPTTGRIGYITPALRGSPTFKSGRQKNRSGPQVGGLAKSPLTYGGSPTLRCRGQKCEVAHKLVDLLHHACRLQDPKCLRVAEKNHTWPIIGRIANITTATGGPSTLQSGGPIQKWPKSGRMGGLATSPLLSEASTTLWRGGRQY